MKDKPLPKYRQLKNEIMTWLQNGQLKPGDQMPSEHEVASRFHISRQTVRQTLGELEKEGWLQRFKGKGTFVAQPETRRRQDARTIGMLTTYISDYIFPHIVRGAEAALRERGYGLLLSSTENDKEKETESLGRMLDLPLRGLIVEPTRSALGNPNLNFYLTLQYHNIPFIMINERYPEMNCPCVKVNDEAGGFKAAEHLIRLGHTLIAGFFKTDDLQGVNRLKGFIRAHQQYKLPLTPEIVIHYATEEKNSKPVEAALSMLRQEKKPTAFVCYNDELAVKLLDAVRRSGRRVPEDVSVVGFDDSTLATATEVKLTTLTHPKTDMGARAADMLIDLIENKDAAEPVKDIVYEPDLIIRDSTRNL